MQPDYEAVRLLEYSSTWHLVVAGGNKVFCGIDAAKYHKSTRLPFVSGKQSPFAYGDRLCSLCERIGRNNE